MSESKGPPKTGDGPHLKGEEVNTASSFASLLDRQDGTVDPGEKDAPDPPEVFSLKDGKEDVAEVEEPDPPELELNMPTPDGDQVFTVTLEESPSKDPSKVDLEEVRKTPSNEKLSQTFRRARDRGR